VIETYSAVGGQQGARLISAGHSAIGRLGGVQGHEIVWEIVRRFNNVDLSWIRTVNRGLASGAYYASELTIYRPSPATEHPPRRPYTAFISWHVSKIEDEQAMGPALYARQTHTQAAQVRHWVEDLRRIDAPGGGTAGAVDYAMLLRGRSVYVMDVAERGIASSPEVKVVEERRAGKSRLHAILLGVSERERSEQKGDDADHARRHYGRFGRGEVTDRQCVDVVSSVQKTGRCIKRVYRCRLNERVWLRGGKAMSNKWKTIKVERGNRKFG